MLLEVSLTMIDHDGPQELERFISKDSISIIEEKT